MIPWKHIEDDLPVRQIPTMCESYLLTYLVRHPERISENLTLVGVEAWITKNDRVDLLFMKGKEYFVIETKEFANETTVRQAKEKAKNYAILLERFLQENNIDYSGITPVGAAVDYSGSSGPWTKGGAL